MNDIKIKDRFLVNYLYYGFYFCSLVFFSVVNVSLSNTLYPGSKLYIIIYSTAYSFLEVSLLVAIGQLVMTKCHSKVATFLFLAATFYLYLIHLVDFILIRVIGSSLFALLGLMLQETWANFMEILQLAGIPLYLWIITAISILLLSIVPYFLYRRTLKFCSLHPWEIKHKKHLLITITILPLAIFLMDKSNSHLIPEKEQEQLCLSLPWKSTLIPKENDYLHSPNYLKRPPSSYIKELAVTNTAPLTKKPNIYLFVVESTRKDYITDEITPNINKLSNEYLSPKVTLANANNTHNAWFSIFHSALPYHWVDSKKSEKGALPLQLLKKMGYQIRAYSSSQLSYYNVQELLFGKDDALLEEFIHFPHNNSPAHLSDKNAIETVKERSLTHPEGQLFIIFIDSTHFHYSFPTENKSSLYEPYEGEPPFYVSALPSKVNRIKIRNRYRNSLKNVDNLFGQFRKELENRNTWDESIVILSADHGEEFFEQGQMFHASHLSCQQLEIPIIYKFPSTEKRKLSPKNISSQMDIFPTLLDVLGQKNLDKIFEGDSLFAKTYWPFVMSARYNGGVAPYEFSLQSDRKKIVGRFSRKKQLYSSKGIEILSFQKRDDSPIEDQDELVIDYFEMAFKKLFPPTDDSK